MNDIAKSIDRLKYLHAIPQNDREARDFAPACRKELPEIFVRLAEVERQNADLQAANNRYLERARLSDTRAENAEAEGAQWAGSLQTAVAQRETLKAELAELRERIARLPMQGGHQLWCALFGETVGWNDDLIYKIEPFMMKFVARLKEGLERPFSDRERETFKTMVRCKLEAEKEHDAAHEDGELAQAAAVYALKHMKRAIPCFDCGRTIADQLWPWEPKWLKSSGRRRDLEKAGALILAEIERLDRLPAPPAGEGTNG